jgi:class 3 adenylate cyclase
MGTSTAQTTMTRRARSAIFSRLASPLVTNGVDAALDLPYESAGAASRRTEGGDVLAEVRLPLVLQLHKRGVRIAVERPHAPMADAPSQDAATAGRVLRTVMVTDLVDSTMRVAEAGDGSWRATLDGHDDLVRAELARYDGREVKSLGDGVLAVFDAPCRAIRCAQSIAEGVQGLGLRARAGIHTGEVERRGLDIAGLAVHIGARVAGMAAAGEVLVSGVVPPLVMGSGLAFDDRGDHQLRGVPGSWRLFAVR